jgi:PAS domain S-box-containing protein
MQYTVYQVLAPIACVVAIGSTLIAWRGRKVSGFSSLIWLLVCVTGFLFTNLLEFLTPDQTATIFWARMQYIFVTFLPVFWIAFAFEYTGHIFWLKPSHFWVLCIIPILTLICVLYDPFLQYIWRDFTFVKVGEYFLVLKVLKYGPWFWVFTFFSYPTVLGGALALVLPHFKTKNVYQYQSRWITVGAVLPLTVNFIYLSRIIPGLTKDFSPVAYTLAGVCFTIGIFRYQLLDLMPVARATLVDSMSDGVIVLDRSGRVIDINPAARLMFSIPAKQGIGDTITQLLPDWNEWLAVENIDGEQKKPIEIDFRQNEVKKSYELHLTDVADTGRNPQGKLLIIRDVSERRLAEEALFQAHLDMERRVVERTAELAALNKTLEERVAARTRELSALFEVSAVASQASDIDKLMAETLERTMSAIPSTLGAIYLMDERSTVVDNQNLKLMTQKGIHPNFTPVINALANQDDILNRAIEHQKPLQVSNTVDYDQINAIIQHSDPITILLAPMFAGRHLLGVMVLGNEPGQGFRQEDVALLSSIVDQISLAAHSHRLRHQTIVYEERQRLARDLHDSVTQSLYGLVTLTEAGQAQLESGVVVPIGHTLVRIGQTARQALKEMRLYIYELRPPTLEQEGLVGALHLRLTAVEGRSNIKTRLVTNGTVNLSPVVTNALYHIAQEALNNILKHTLSTSVTVYLNQTDEAISLEVVDNGQGFDSDKLLDQGMGLANMRERAREVGGVFEITSSINKGTQVKVTIPQKA